MIGFVLTAWSAIRSSKIALYLALAGVFALAVFIYLKKRDARVAKEIFIRGVEAAMKRNRRARQIHSNIQTLPLSERAERLRRLGQRGGNDET